MGFEIKIEDNTAKALLQIAQNRERALTAMGLEAAGGIKGYMEANKIRRTGDLMRSITSRVASETDVAVGTNIEYATFVHEGTSKMAGRPYITNGINGNLGKIQQVAEEALKEGF